MIGAIGYNGTRVVLSSKTIGCKCWFQEKLFLFLLMQLKIFEMWKFLKNLSHFTDNESHGIFTFQKIACRYTLWSHHSNNPNNINIYLVQASIVSLPSCATPVTIKKILCWWIKVPLIADCFVLLSIDGIKPTKRKKRKKEFTIPFANIAATLIERNETRRPWQWLVPMTTKTNKKLLNCQLESMHFSF